jgi:hypothetical protein
MSGQNRQKNGDLVLGLDPSSTVVGYGILTMDRQFVEAGLCLPEDRAAGSFQRVMEMSDDVEALLARIRPAVVLVEWTRGKVHLGRHHGAGAGLAVYGTGVGAVARQVWLWARAEHDYGRAVTVEAICETDWTRGVPKTARAAAIRTLYPQLSADADPGLDMHDAVGLAEWWLRNRLVR